MFGHCSVIQTLPAELQDTIVDFASNDRRCLEACSLTCKAWLSRAQYHLFRSLKIDPSRGDAIRSLLCSSPHIGRLVRVVEISGTAANTGWWSATSGLCGRWPTLHNRDDKVTETSEVITWLQRVLPPCPQIFRRTTSLTLSSIPVSAALANVLQPYFSESVTKLVFNGCMGPSFHDYILLKRALPHVIVVHMLDARWLPHTGVPPGKAIDRNRAMVKTLHLSKKIDVVTLVTWLLQESRYQHLTNLSCYISTKASAIAIKKLLDAAGPNLEHLGIGIADISGPSDVLKATNFNLSTCTALRSLRITGSAPDQIRQYNPSFSWIIILLSKVEAPSLSVLYISITVRDLPSLNLGALPAILSRGRFKSLFKVVFELKVETIKGQKLLFDQKAEKTARGRLASLPVHIEFYQDQ